MLNGKSEHFLYIEIFVTRGIFVVCIKFFSKIFIQLEVNLFRFESTFAHLTYVYCFYCVPGSVFQRNTVNRCVCIQKEIYFKELTHTVIEADKSRICIVGQQARDPEENRYYNPSPKTVCGGILLVPDRGQSFVLFTSSFDQIKPTCFTEGKQLYSSSSL